MDRFLKKKHDIEEYDSESEEKLNASKKAKSHPIQKYNESIYNEL